MATDSVDVPVLLQQAKSLHEHGNAADAATVFEYLTQEAPTSVEVWAGFGMALHDSGRLEEAVTAFRTTLTLMPNLGSAHVVLGSVLRQLGRYDDAAESLDAAIQIKTDNPSAWANLGLVRIDQGRIAEARKSLERALELDAMNARAAIGLASLKKAEAGDETFGKLEALVASEKISREDHAGIHYTLGKMYADTGDFDRSFAEYRQANQLQYIDDLFLQRSFDALSWVSDIEDLCAAALPDHAPEDRPSKGPTPVFILGMPRSGKTLVEQALARHPEVAALGEAPLFREMALEAGLLPAVVGVQNPAGCDAWGTDVAETLAKAHEEKLVTTTLSENVELLPLIAKALPHARVIFCRRDPLDVSLSCYFKDLPVSHNYSNHLDALGLVHRRSLQVMQHFMDSSHLACSEVAYEDLVRDPEPTIRRLLDCVGLEYDPLCLPPADAEIDIVDLGPARSLRLDAPLSSSFVGLSRNYERRLPGLMTAVGNSEEAERQCRSLLEVNPEDADALANLGRAFGVAGRLDEARRALDRAVQLEPGNAKWHAARARFLAVQGEHGEAIADYWQALAVKPYNLEIPRFYSEMKECIRVINPELGQLHDDVTAEFCSTRQMFGAHGLPYQSFEPLWIPGSRPSAERYETYRLDEVINEKTSVLDIGCNAGFMTLLCAAKARRADAFDVEGTLINIGELVKGHLDIQNVNLYTCGFHEIEVVEKYDLVLSFAVHRWIGVPMAEYAVLLRDMLADDGVVVFESQGQRDTEVVEADFDEKITCLADAGLDLLWQGELTDDGVNRRRFVVLRKNG